ncbi:cuticlin 1 [Loa loa]|uniref:Cuticlin 1 n=2 Tax=Loa loa TaxID=7209 RepID=A0A1S0U2F4_LOALO|nr:cuticlin 1 [Loa loa]EFO24074.2 cuticlin 1 [Loa loa]
MLLRYHFSNLLYLLWFGFVLRKSSETGLTIETDNGLVGSPEIKCNPETIELAFKTKREFRGKVFVKGHYNNPNCRVDYGKPILDSKNPVGSITLSHGQCDMNRQRMIQPEGMQLSTILVISFHPLFITKLDRAFHIRCMYREIVRAVSSGIEVSAIATQGLEYQYPFPNCIYTIRRDEIDGPILKYARVGDQIVHRWECLSDVYGLLVHNCYVEDGQGEKQIIIDENGCHTDRTVLGDPTYVESLNMAYRESLVFKFADRIIVQFKCQIRLCVRDGGGCIGITPPMCYDEKEKTNEVFVTTDDSVVNHAIKLNDVTDIHSKKRRLMRSSVSERSRLIVDADLISQLVYVLDADDDDGAGDELRNFHKN